MIIELKDEEIKKGAAPGYLEELAGRLWRERIHTLPVQNGLLTVTLEDRPVGVVAENGDAYQLGYAGGQGSVLPGAGYRPGGQRV